ncbi:MAG: UDP-N-acetylglucosamine 2-epimerase [Acinetobacter sp.]|nr:UDP-N-acetylglucosamine 2-epimerase [Acinetobacter sp.]
MKKILFITGTRADFGKLKPLLNFVEQQHDVELHLIVTGMHMMQAYGSTYIEVLREKYQHVYLAANQFQGEPMSSVLGNTITLLSRFVAEIEPDLLVIHGDRLEALAGATVGALSNCLVCHIEGGELSGTIDDSIRHAVSKLSHIHLVANQDAKQRLIQMGEKSEHIFIIGSPDLDVMQSKSLPNLDDVKRYYDIDFDDYAVSLFHPVTTESEQIAHYAEQYFAALRQSGKNYVVIYPNNDTGTEAILHEIQKLKTNPQFRCFPSVRFEAFLVLLKNATFIIGNSSAGIREAPFYGVATVNVGTRQNKRANAPSIINSDYAPQAILNAIAQACALTDLQPSQTFGDGDSVSRFAEFLTQSNVWQTNLQKSFVDM